GGVGVLGVFGVDKVVLTGGAQVGQLLAADGRLLGQILLGLGLIVLHTTIVLSVYSQTGAGTAPPPTFLLRARNGQHLVHDDIAVGQGDVHFVTGFVADQRGAHRAFVADAVEVHVRLGGTGDVVLLGVLGEVLFGQDLYAHTDRDSIVGQFTIVNVTSKLQRSFQVRDAGLDNGLLLFGGVILGVFTQVPVTAGDLDLIRHFLAFDGAQFFQVLLQFLVSLTGNDDFFSHARLS